VTGKQKLPLLFLFLTACLGPAVGAGAEDAAEPLERILNPLPEYDPFDQPPPAPQFFPDDVDKRARAAMIDALTRKDEELAGHVRFFAERDAQLKKERGASTGLTGYVFDLQNNTIRDREAYLEGQRKALSFSLAPGHRQVVESRINNDELTRANDLLKTSATNRWGGVVNRVLSSVDLMSVLTGNYAGAAADTAVQQLMALGSSDMPSEERRALAMLQEHLKRYPDDPKNPEIRKQIDALEKKKRRALAQQQVEKAEEAVDKNEWTKAAFHYESASLTDPSAREAETGAEQLNKRLQQREEKTQRALTVVSPGAQGASAPEPAEVKELLSALALRDTEQIEARARALAEANQKGPLAASARDAEAVALEIKGQHEEAKKILRQVARASNAPHERSRAEALLSSSEYNLLGSFQQARTDHRLKTVKYVLLGDDFLRKNLMMATGPLVTGGPIAGPSIAAANMIIIGTNLFQVLTNNPISYETVIDRGVEYIRNHPESESATEVYSVLADAYADKGNYEKAIEYHQLSGGAAEKKIADLKDKAAKSLLQTAAKSGDRSTQELYLKAILDEYPESEAAKEATQRLARLTKIENQGLRMTKQFLMENPELVGPQGLRLKPSLFDGNLTNMELADRGISLLGQNEILLNLQTPWGVRSQTYPMAPQTSERFQTALRSRNYDLAMASADTRAKGSQGGIKNLPSSIVGGQLAKKPADRGTDETTFTLVREAGGSTTAYPKILDHQLMTEAERNPASRNKLPPIQGSISASGVNLSGGLPVGLWGDRFTFGTDAKSPFGGVQLPIPLLQGFIPVDFMVQGRPGGFSLSPKIHLSRDKGEDPELYR